MDTQTPNLLLDMARYCTSSPSVPPMTGFDFIKFAKALLILQDKLSSYRNQTSGRKDGGLWET